MEVATALAMPSGVVQVLILLLIVLPSLSILSVIHSLEHNLGFIGSGVFLYLLAALGEIVPDEYEIVGIACSYLSVLGIGIDLIDAVIHILDKDLLDVAMLKGGF